MGHCDLGVPITGTDSGCSPDQSESTQTEGTKTGGSKTRGTQTRDDQNSGTQARGVPRLGVSRQGVLRTGDMNINNLKTFYSKHQELPCQISSVMVLQMAFHCELSATKKFL